MKLNISTATAMAVSKIDSADVWVLLLEIALPNNPDHIYLAYNNEDVVWNDQLWQAFPFSISEGKSDAQGSASTLNIDVDNTSRDLEFYLQTGSGGAGAKVTLRCVIHGSTSSEPEFEEYFSVKSTSVTAQSVRFNLGNAYPSQARRTWDRYMKNSCPFKYKGLKCAAVSDLPDCDHTLAACRKRNNSKRFGGFAGIPQGGLYV